MKEHWRYLIARYGALPVVWCAAGEGTMPFYGSRPAKRGRAPKTRLDGRDSFDPGDRSFSRMITIHPSRAARETVADPSLLDFDMLQTGHQPQDAIGQMAKLVRGEYQAKPTMPVIAGESSYDALDLREFGGAVLSSDDSRQMLWVGLMNNGAAGGTYGANGIWQVNRREAPYGPSPHGKNWGTIPWDESMRLPSSAQAGFAKRFLEAFPWFHLEAWPETVKWADDQPTKGDIWPSAVGIETRLRIVYVPRHRQSLWNASLRKPSTRSSLFDPITGVRSSAGTIRTDANGATHSPRTTTTG